MPTLQANINRVVGKKVYVQYTVIIPPKDIERLGWKKGDQLDIYKKGKTLIVEKD